MTHQPAGVRQYLPIEADLEACTPGAITAAAAAIAPVEPLVGYAGGQLVCAQGVACLVGPAVDDVARALLGAVPGALARKR